MGALMGRFAWIGMLSLLAAGCTAPVAAPKADVRSYDDGVAHGLRLASARIQLEAAQTCNDATRGSTPSRELPSLEETCRIYAKTTKLVFDGADDHLLGEVP